MGRPVDPPAPPKPLPQSSQVYVAGKNATCATCKRVRYATLATCPFCPPAPAAPVSPVATPAPAAAPTADFLDDEELYATDENPCGESAARGQDQHDPDRDPDAP